MNDELMFNLELNHVMELLSQCLSPMEQLQCYLSGQQGSMTQVYSLLSCVNEGRLRGLFVPLFPLKIRFVPMHFVLQIYQLVPFQNFE